MNTLTRCAAIIGFALAAASPAAAQSADDLNRMQSFLSLVQNYFGLIEATHEISDDPEKAAILQMQKIQEVYEDRGEKARAQEVFRRVIEESDNQTIRNAAFLLLGDSLKETGRHEEAIDVLQQALAENVRAAD
ncbi:MAG: tetratricopeptide repeat protein [Pseudomonadota bacterium]